MQIFRSRKVRESLACHWSQSITYIIVETLHLVKIKTLEDLRRFRYIFFMAVIKNLIFFGRNAVEVVVDLLALHRSCQGSGSSSLAMANDGFGTQSLNLGFHQTKNLNLQKSSVLLGIFFKCGVEKWNQAFSCQHFNGKDYERQEFSKFKCW